MQSLIRHIGLLFLILIVGANDLRAQDDGTALLFSNESLPSFPAVESEVESNAPAELSADVVEYDQKNEIVTAKGNIELAQAGRLLRASKIDYDLNNDVVTATGDVVLRDTAGELYYADSFELKDEMKDGFVRGLRGVLLDGSNFSAEEAEKIQDIKILMRKASYTACERCESEPDKVIPWELKARTIEHDKVERRISYKDATLEVRGMPVVYVPYFSHADGSIKRKSGFLTPSMGYDTDLGATYQQDYYWSIAPDKDATIGVMAMTQEAPMLLAEYRQRFENADLEVNGGVTYSGRTDRVGNVDVARDEEVRGYLFSDAKWHLNDKWRAGSELEIVSDEQFLRQYNLSNEDVLENRLYVERFEERDYALVQAIRFKDVRVSDDIDQPNVIPEVYTNFVGQPNKTLGGRWHVEASALGLQRSGSEQDVARANVETGWSRLFSSDVGVITEVTAAVRGDAYRVNDRAGVSVNQSGNSSALRGFAYTHLKTALPLERQFETYQMLLEPLLAMTLGSNIDNNEDIPNEDSQDVFLDANNIFNPNRFPGYDRIEDNVHATYGLRTGIYNYKGHKGEIFLGQSYRFDDEDNPFQNGSGLEERESDFVGSVTAELGGRFRLNYGLQLKNDTLTSQRHEVDMGAVIGPANITARYFYADALEGTNLDRRREQMRGGVRYRLSDAWTAYGGAQYDLARETEGLRQVVYGFEYEGQCVNFSANAKRNITRNSSGDSGTQIIFRVGLKNIGEFETSAFTLGEDDKNDDEGEDLEDELVE